MTKDELQNLGLSDEQIEKVLDLARPLNDSIEKLTGKVNRKNTALSEKDSLIQKLNDEIYKRDFDSALAQGLSGIKFSSKTAEAGFISQVKAHGGKLENGTIENLQKLLTELQENDPAAFVQAEGNEVKWTAPVQNQPKKLDMNTILQMANSGAKMDFKALVDQAMKGE